MREKQIASQKYHLLWNSNDWQMTTKLLIVISDVHPSVSIIQMGNLRSIQDVIMSRHEVCVDLIIWTETNRQHEECQLLHGWYGHWGRPQQPNACKFYFRSPRIDLDGNIICSLSHDGREGFWKQNTSLALNVLEWFFMNLSCEGSKQIDAMQERKILHYFVFQSQSRNYRKIFKPGCW